MQKLKFALSERFEEGRERHCKMLSDCKYNLKKGVQVADKIDCETPFIILLYYWLNLSYINNKNQFTSGGMYFTAI
jgi:hypothetical protein